MAKRITERVRQSGGDVLADMGRPDAEELNTSAFSEMV
jgi:hypothetical protein